ncbi:hypothetical protein, partial [Escherichia coli]|uniref:hypothetical protein n=1 Tax=Escherichia coli TaxID=562 RepID=UPI003F1EBBBE
MIHRARRASRITQPVALALKATPLRRRLPVMVAIPVVVMAAVLTREVETVVATTGAGMAEAVPIPVVVMVAAVPGRGMAMVVETTGEGMVAALVPVRAQAPARVMAMVRDNPGATVMRYMSRKARPSRSSTTTSLSASARPRSLTLPRAFL